MRKFVAIFMFVLLGVVSCSHETDFSPRKPNYDRDVCYVCKMGLDNPKYNVQAINEHGNVRWYDDIGCLAEDIRDMDFNKWKGQKYKIWIGDAETGEWIDAEKAYYRFGDETPMGYGYGALKDKSEAKPGDTLYDFKSVLKRIEQGKTMREEFLKKKKMSVSGGEMKCGAGKCGKGKCGTGKCG